FRTLVVRFRRCGFGRSRSYALATDNGQAPIPDYLVDHRRLLDFLGDRIAEMAHRHLHWPVADSADLHSPVSRWVSRDRHRLLGHGMRDVSGLALRAAVCGHRAGILHVNAGRAVAVHASLRGARQREESAPEASATAEALEVLVALAHNDP